jgi:hypothetical protein
MAHNVNRKYKISCLVNVSQLWKIFQFLFQKKYLLSVNTLFSELFPKLNHVAFEEYHLLGYDTLHDHRCENLKSYMLR